jgi:hypothetical protein
MSMRTALLLAGCLLALGRDAEGRTSPARSDTLASQPASSQPPLPPGTGKPKPGVPTPLPPPLPPQTNEPSLRPPPPILEVVHTRVSRSLKVTMRASPLQNCSVSYSAPSPPPSKATRLRGRTDTEGHLRMTIPIPPSIGSTVQITAWCGSDGDRLAAVETVRLGR